MDFGCANGSALGIGGTFRMAVRCHPVVSVAAAKTLATATRTDMALAARWLRWGLFKSFMEVHPWEGDPMGRSCTVTTAGSGPSKESRPPRGYRLWRGGATGGVGYAGEVISALSRSLVAVLLAAVWCACVSPTSTLRATAVTDLSALRGAWRGDVRAPGGGPLPVTLLINDDGSYQARGPGAGALLVEGRTRIAAGELVLESDFLVVAAGSLYATQSGDLLRVVRTDGRLIGELTRRR
jgi:hypothetical protein